MRAFVSSLHGVHARVEPRIDYEPHWLAKYDYGLSDRDKRLKLVELARVEEKLKGAKKFGDVSKWLDIGTGTGRYPISLVDAVRVDGEIVAIDADLDCVNYATGRLQRELPTSSREVRVLHVDFLNSGHVLTQQFDLITCTMGTLSHFGVDRRPEHPIEDGIQRALLGMVRLLKDAGRLFLGTWSDVALGEAGRKPDLLGIYKDSDRRRLVKWSPTENELKDRISSAGLEVLSMERPDDRIVIWECERRRS
jgi:SAM-dependent methyltransferase